MSWLTGIADFLTFPTRTLGVEAIARNLGLSPRAEDFVPPEMAVQEQNPFNEEMLSALRRDRAISEGVMVDPSVAQAQESVRRAGNQAYGLAMSSPMASAAAQTRLARGARSGVRTMAAPQLEQARLQAQDQASQRYIANEQARIQQERERIRRQREARIEGEMLAAEALKKQQGVISGTTSGVVGSLLGSISDRNEKKNIKDGKEKTKKFLDSLSAKEFEYKDGDGGITIGIMAQDAAKSKAGSGMVKDLGGTLMIDTAQATGPMLAALSELNERIKKLEGKNG